MGLSERTQLGLLDAQTEELILNYINGVGRNLSDAVEEVSRTAQMLEGKDNSKNNIALATVFNTVAKTANVILDGVRDSFAPALEEFGRFAEGQLGGALKQYERIKAAYNAVEYPTYKEPELSSEGGAITVSEETMIMASYKKMGELVASAMQACVELAREVNDNPNFLVQAFVVSHNTARDNLVSLNEFFSDSSTTFRNFLEKSEAFVASLGRKSTEASDDNKAAMKTLVENSMVDVSAATDGFDD